MPTEIVRSSELAVRSVCEFGSKTFIDAIARVCAAASKHGKSLGRLVPTVQQGVELYGQGFDFICYSGDVWVLHDALSEATQPFEYVAVAEGAQGGRNLRIELFGGGDVLDGLDVGEIAGKLVHKRRQFVFLGRK